MTRAGVSCASAGASSACSSSPTSSCASSPSPHATRAETVEWLLDVCDSTPIYRARYLGAARLSQMLNLLLYDDGHPMALVFLRRSVDRDLDDLARGPDGERERGVPDVPLLPQGAAELLDAAEARRR